MGDIGEKEASEVTRISGAESDGTETYLAKVSPNQDVGMADSQDTAFIQTVLTVDDITPVILKVGVSNLANRKELGVENIGNQKGFIGTSSVSNSDANINRGSTLEASAIRTFPYGPNIDLYIIAKAGQTIKVIVWESA